MVFVNGKFCKDPKDVTANDFFRPGLNVPGNTSNQLGSVVNAVNVNNLPGLNTLGISLARIDFSPYGLNPPHTHPRRTEVLGHALHWICPFEPWSKYEEQTLYQDSTSRRCVRFSNRSYSFSV
ncbi:hypothetical protein RDI58_002996 [Solanum bulbocastanum]|uniref:Cupin type-1 domain-containing protein n=1 Tax=Solanum bulbocastanum TaxID=147425 RepID=A0AAN8UGN3_SOLBU